MKYGRAIGSGKMRGGYSARNSCEDQGI